MKTSYAVPDTLQRPGEWAAQASCRSGKSDPDMWHSPVEKDRARAKAVCHECPVEDRCLAYATDVEDGKPPALRWGVWGGMDENERYDYWRRARGLAPLKIPRSPRKRKGEEASGSEAA